MGGLYCIKKLSKLPYCCGNKQIGEFGVGHALLHPEYHAPILC